MSLLALFYGTAGWLSSGNGDVLHRLQFQGLVCGIPYIVGYPTMGLV